MRFPRSEKLLFLNLQRFRGGLVFKAHRLFYHSTLGLRVIKKKKKVPPIKSSFSGPCFVLARAGTRRLVVHVKAVEKDGLLSL